MQSEPSTSSPPPPPYTALTVGRVMLYTAAVLVVVFLANLLSRVVDLLFLLLIGILLATAIDPLARRLRGLGLNRPASILSVYLLIFIVIGGLFAFIIPPVVTQATDFATNIPVSRIIWSNGTQPVIRHGSVASRAMARRNSAISQTTPRILPVCSGSKRSMSYPAFSVDYSRS